MKKKSNKKWPTPRQKVIYNPIPTYVNVLKSNAFTITKIFR